MRKILWRLALVGLLSSLVLTSAWAQKLGESLGVPVVVENRPGAGSAVGSNLVAKATLFDPLRDIAMVSMVSSYPFIVNVMAGTEIVHIPTKGGNVALTELLAGRIDFLLEAPTLSLPYIQSGKLRALAVTGKERSKSLADLPTVAESLPGYDVISFIGLGTTSGKPEPILAQLSAEMKKIIEQPDTAKRLQDLGGEPQASTPEEIKRFVEQKFRKWRKVVDVRKIEAL